MVGGPIFGQQPRFKQAAFILIPIAAVALLVYLLSGCAHEPVRYAPIPADLIPSDPILPKIKSEEIPSCKDGQKPCMTDETYIKFAEMIRALKQQILEMRALLGEGKV